MLSKGFHGVGPRPVSGANLIASPLADGKISLAPFRSVPFSRCTARRAQLLAIQNTSTLQSIDVLLAAHNNPRVRCTPLLLCYRPLEGKEHWEGFEVAEYVS